MGPTQHASWSPYDNNGGCCVAVAGEDYCVVAADTRMSTGFSIMTRDCEKIVKLCVPGPRVGADAGLGCAEEPRGGRERARREL